MVEQARRVLDEGRRTGLPILFTTVAYEDADLAGRGGLGDQGARQRDAPPGSPEVEQDDRLGRAEGESILVKKYASAFFGTDLLSRLNALRVDTLVIVGCTTSGCVRATAVDAIQNGFRPIVVREAVGDRDPAAHEQSLRDLQAKYADVVSADAVVAHLASLPGGVPVP